MFKTLLSYIIKIKYKMYFQILILIFNKKIIDISIKKLIHIRIMIV